MSADDLRRYEIYEGCRIALRFWEPELNPLPIEQILSEVDRISSCSGFKAARLSIAVLKAWQRLDRSHILGEHANLDRWAARLPRHQVEHLRAVRDLQLVTRAEQVEKSWPLPTKAPADETA